MVFLRVARQGRAHGAYAFGASIALAALGAACDKSPFEADRIPDPPAASARPAAPMGYDAGFVLERPDPVGPAGNLREDVAGFSSLDTCVSQHAVQDPVVNDAVRSIGYDTLLRDACRVLQALKMKDSTFCSPITASSLEHHCQALVAMELQMPEKCPWRMSSEKARGRDPVCLAVATRDPRTCGAAAESGQATCEALASGDPARCGRAAGDEHATCARDFDREHSLLAAEHEAHDTPPPRAHLEIHGTSGSAAKDPPVPDVDLSASVLGGAVVASEGIDGVGIELARDLEIALHLPTRTDRAHLALSVAYEAGAPKLEKMSLVVPKLPVIDCPSARCSIAVTMPKTDPQRGAPLSATLEGTVDTTSGTYQLKLRIDTFVRDIVARSDLYGGVGR